MMPCVKILLGDWVDQLRTLPDQSVQCCVTSPPYWGLRDYGVSGQLGLEKTPAEYVAKLVAGFREVKRVLRDDATLWLNLGDCYATQAAKWGGSNGNSPCKQNTNRGSERRSKVEMPVGLNYKNKLGIPWRVAFAMQKDGWILRQDIIWHKPNPMPESVDDRPTTTHEYIFLLTKQPWYFYDAEAIKEPVTGDAHMRKANGAPSRSNIPGVTPKSQPAGSGIKANESFHAACTDLVSNRNKRSVWTVASAPYKGAHYATFPPDLIKPCILAGTSERGCCPKCGRGWERVLEDSEHREKIDYNGKHLNTDKSSAGRNILASVRAARQSGNDHDNPFPPKKTIGWRPACKCGLTQTVTCTVLDPFFGSGTVGQVALEYGRNCIGIELNPDYLDQSKTRTNVTPGLALA